MDRRIVIFGGLAVLFGQGCSGSPALVYPQWVGASTSSFDSSSGYGHYCRAAELAEKDGQDLAPVVNFTLGKRRQLQEKMSAGLKEISAGQHAGSFGYVAEPTPLGKLPNHHTGFRLLGRALTFQIEDAIDRGDYGTAVEKARVATEFGFDLCNGNAMDASLGLSIADDARRALAPALPSLSAGQLRNLAKEFHVLLERRPSMTVSLDNERVQMLQSLQSLQEGFRGGVADNMASGLNLPRAAQKAIDELKGKSDKDRLAFFQGFADEIERKSRYWRDLVGLPLELRDPKQGKIEKLQLATDRPWRVFSDQFASLGDPLIAMSDENLARTRLLVLQSAILSLTKAGSPAPKDIAKFGDTSVDPFTGHPFAYRASGADFRVYSVGPNLIDDGGQSDDSGLGLDVFYGD
jgi:hypothetical protein